MVQLLRALLVLGGLLFVGIGAMFLIDPVRMGVEFGIVPQGNQGLSTIRSDFLAIFLVAGGSMILGAWKQRGGILLVAAALMGTICAARGVSLALDGTYPGWHQPMAAEALTVVLALAGYRMFARA